MIDRVQKPEIGAKRSTGNAFSIFFTAFNSVRDLAGGGPVVDG